MLVWYWIKYSYNVIELLDPQPLNISNPFGEDNKKLADYVNKIITIVHEEDSGRMVMVIFNTKKEIMQLGSINDPFTQAQDNWKIINPTNNNKLTISIYQQSTGVRFQISSKIFKFDPTIEEILHEVMDFRELFFFYVYMHNFENITRDRLHTLFKSVGNVIKTSATNIDTISHDISEAHIAAGGTRWLNKWPNFEIGLLRNKIIGKRSFCALQCHTYASQQVVSSEKESVYLPAFMDIEVNQNPNVIRNLLGKIFVKLYSNTNNAGNTMAAYLYTNTYNLHDEDSFNEFKKVLISKAKIPIQVNGSLVCSRCRYNAECINNNNDVNMSIIKATNYIYFTDSGRNVIINRLKKVNDIYNILNGENSNELNTEIINIIKEKYIIYEF